MTNEQGTTLQVGDMIRYPAGGIGIIISVDAGVSIETAHGRDWMSYRHARLILTKVEE